MVSVFRKTLLSSARATGVPLSDKEALSLEKHYDLLLDWGRKMNLTGLKDAEAIVRRHFLEPIAASVLLDDEGRLVDLGSGNGFPAVPLKVLRPGLELVLVESSERKSAFLWTVIRELGLKNARVETRHVARLADLSDLLPCRHLTCRAISTQDILKGDRPPILEPAGTALFFVTPAQVRTLESDPPPGLRLSGTRPLPGARSVLAILQPG